MHTETKQTTYRVSPLLLIYPTAINEKRQLIAETFCNLPPLVIKDARVTMWMASLPDTFHEETAEELWSELDAPVDLFASLWSSLLTNGIILDCESKSLERFNLWQQYGWSEAAVYHEATRSYPFIKMDESAGFDEDNARMLAYVEQELPPNKYQIFDGRTEAVQLIKHDNGIALEEYVTNLSDEERFGHKGLSVLFDICFGERKQEVFGCQGSFLKKVIPSGGARHPLEVFYFSFEGGPAPVGLYHYNVAQNSLDRLGSENYYDRVENATYDLMRKYNDEKPVGLFVFTVLPERAMWRYRDARSYRAILIDVGHALSVFRMVSKKLGYRHYTYQKFKDADLSTLLGIDTSNQIPLFVGTLMGKKEHE